jgi:hypothetical protein
MGVQVDKGAQVSSQVSKLQLEWIIGLATIVEVEICPPQLNNFIPRDSKESVIPREGEVLDYCICCPPQIHPYTECID